MHATRDTSDVIKLHRACGRVMRGVGRLVAEHGIQRFAGLVACAKKQLRLVWRAWLSSLVADVSGGQRALCAPRPLKLWPPPNKRMHPTADTNALM